MTNTARLVSTSSGMRASNKAALQVICDPQVHPVQAEFAREQAFADALTGDTATSILSVWRCPRALLVTPPETRLPSFEQARDLMRTDGWPVVLRKSGGGACPVGPGTVQIALVETAGACPSLNAKYEVLGRLVHAALSAFQIDSCSRPVAGAYCPGRYDIAVAGRKIAGMSQRWFRNRRDVHCVITSASLNVEEPPDILAGVVNDFYSRAGGAQRCEAAALANMRLCGASSSKLVSAVMAQIVHGADVLGITVQQNLRDDPRRLMPATAVQQN
jgi:lipoate-protein ligase A